MTSLAQPAGNITGIAVAAQLLEGKRLELLVDLLGPSARKFVWLGNPKNPSVNALWADAAATASHLTVNIVRLELILNLRTAKALGLMVPPAILLRTDELIE